MKATLSFNLPEEEEDLRGAQRWNLYHGALWEFSLYLRDQERHTEPSKRDDIIAIRKKFYEILEEEGVTEEEI